MVVGVLCLLLSTYNLTKFPEAASAIHYKTENCEATNAYGTALHIGVGGSCCENVDVNVLVRPPGLTGQGLLRVCVQSLVGQ